MNDRHTYKKTIQKAGTILLNRNILILVIVTIGIMPVVVSTGGFIIHGDSTTQILPFVYETKRMLSTGLPFWSWNTYLGDNFYSTYAYYTLFNPFTWINCLFPYRYLDVGFTVVLYLKFLTCGYVAQKYLKKIGFDDKLSLTGCLLYTFSSWAVSNLFYYMFMEPMILFVLLLIFVERYLRDERHGFTGLAIVVAVMVMINYYFAAINLIAGMIYFFVRLPYTRDDGPARIKCVLKGAGSVTLGIMCASAVLVPVFIRLRTTPHAPYNLDFGNLFETLDRILWLVFPKAHESGDHYVFFKRTWNSNAASIAIFGILPMLLLYKKKGYGWIKWYAGIMVALYVTPLNGVFSLFSEWYYTRWAYILSLAIIVSTLYYLRDYGLPRLKKAIWYCVIVYGGYLILIGMSAYWHCHNGTPSETGGKVPRLVLDALLVFVNATALLILCSRSTENKSRTRVPVFIAVCSTVQMLVFTIPNIKEFPNSDLIHTENEYFYNGTYSRHDEDYSFRTDFVNQGVRRCSPCNMGLITNRASLQTFHSMQSDRTYGWNKIVGKRYDKERFFFPENFRKSFEALMSVKEIAIMADEAADTCIDGRLVGTYGLFDVYESDHYIPMGFAFDRYVPADSIRDVASGEEKTDIPKILLSALAVEAKDEAELSPFLRKAHVCSDISLDSVIGRRRAVVCDRFSGHSQGFDAHINLDSSMVVFFSVIADEGFTARIDGEPAKIYKTNLGMSSVVVPAGSHYITFSYFPPGLKAGLLLSAMASVLITLMYRKQL